MSRRITIQADLTSWFNPDSPPCPDFVGVVVFERLKPVKSGFNRIGIAVSSYQRDRYLKEGARMTMPYTAQPSKAWNLASAVGFAASVKEALALSIKD